MKGRWIMIGVAVALLSLLLIAGGAVRTYNRLVNLDERVEGQWAQVESAYQRRADLVPNLVATVQGAAAHERETLTAVTEARARVGALQLAEPSDDPAALARYQAAQEALSSALSRLLAVAEAYPQLRASENFLALQSQLEGTENRIAVERQRFNEAARAFNSARRAFPTVIFAGVLGDRFDEKAYFQAAPAAAEAPKVEF